MRRVRRRGPRRHSLLLIAALAVVGMEVDVLSNPFGPDLVFSRIVSWTLPEPVVPRDDPCADRGSAAETVVQDLATIVHKLEYDHTNALRPRVGAYPQPAIPSVSAFRPAGPSPSHRRSAHPPALARLSTSPRLCRFLC